MTVQRESASPIQIDGELIKAETDVHIEVLPSALTVIVPSYK